jgi:hypothetical protein
MVLSQGARPAPAEVTPGIVFDCYQGLPTRDYRFVGLLFEGGRGHYGRPQEDVRAEIINKSIIPWPSGPACDVVPKAGWRGEESVTIARRCTFTNATCGIRHGPTSLAATSGPKKYPQQLWHPSPPLLRSETSGVHRRCPCARRSSKQSLRCR